ncbi:immunoglobulin gamma-1 heavy chain-like [Ictidomys tridecemlineatus]|nr:immunoglobulin gamma-1 heavy chain-like [Ictidomys tridecemlineatus]
MPLLTSLLSPDNTVNLKPSTTSGKLEVDKIPATSVSALTIPNAEKQDSAPYYCAFWKVHIVLGELEQPEISISREKDKSAQMSCKAILQSFESIDIHWYREKPNQGLEHLIYVRAKYNQRTLGGKNKKFEASKYAQTSTSVLTVNFLGKEDEATYYCACWTSTVYYKKVFGSGTKLVVTDKSFNADIYPKPTIFLPSVAETNLHNAGTYLCLLENFFPDVIKVYWKEKGGDRILESFQGNTMKTNNRYMKMSWLTVTGESMDKEHRCIVKHENNKRGVDQEILFPAIRKVVTTMNPREADLKVTTGEF